MSLIAAHNRWVIAVTFVIALLLMIVPLGWKSGWLRPELVAMLVIYWVLVLPQQSSMLLFWLLGCVQDLIEGVALGQHAMALMVVAYVCLLSYQRIRNYTLWYQAFYIFILVGLHQLVNNWVHSLHGSAAPSLAFLLPAVTSAMLWPALWLLLERLRQSFRIT